MSKKDGYSSGKNHIASLKPVKASPKNNRSCARNSNGGDISILYLEDEVTAEMDSKRIQWAVGDISERYQPLTLCDDAYQVDFEKFMRP